MIRYATEQDLPAIVEIYNHAIVNTTATYDYTPYQVHQRKPWFDRLTQGNYPILVWEEQGEIAGYAALEPFRPDRAYCASVMHSIYLSPNHKGKGIGFKLVEALIIEAKQHDFATMIAEIDGANPASIALHQKLGFTYAGTLKNAAKKFDTWLDLVFYEYDLLGETQ
ncbi:GNAT family N-acetyltransferase [Vibrio eleionomae]|uniref:GNAT family N-acetyltransferase n=1 Tax=Vibrio eleionomae TaxID=2653505 RepID=UPI00136E1AE2|nr:GNAT family N-acetyltransferase [Vibrio eleionomae]